MYLRNCQLLDPIYATLEVCTVLTTGLLLSDLRNMNEHLVTWRVSGGKMFTVPECGLPSFTAEVVEGLSCSWLQPREHRSPDDPYVMGGDCIALLR